MRVITVILFLTAGIAGCRETFLDDTQNRLPVGASYPPGPFGYAVGATIADLELVAKGDPDDPLPRDYSTLGLEPLRLSEFYGRPDIRLVLLVGIAAWCDFCAAEQSVLNDIVDSMHRRGVRVVQVMLDSRIPGVAARAEDIDRWAALHRSRMPIALDPQRVLLNYADRQAFPVNLIVRTSDMEILHMAVGYDRRLKQRTALFLGD